MHPKPSDQLMTPTRAPRSSPIPAIGPLPTPTRNHRLPRGSRMSMLLVVSFVGGLSGIVIVVGDVALAWLSTGDCVDRSLLGLRMTQTNCEFVESPKSVVWFAVVGLHNALWAVLAVALAPMLRALAPQRHAGGGRRAVGLTILVLIPPAILWGLLVTAHPLAGQAIKMLMLAGFAAGVALAGAVGLWRVEAIATGLARKPMLDRIDLAQYLRLRRLLERLIAIEGTILGSVILGTAAFQRAVADTSAAGAGGFPSDYVVIYGGYFSGLLVLVYGTTYWRLREVGVRLRERFVSVANPDDPQWPEAFKKWKELGEFLEVAPAPGNSARVGLAIGAPLVTGVLSTSLSLG